MTGRTGQAIFGTVTLILGCLGVVDVIPVPDVAAYSWWTAGLVILAMSWR